MQQRTKRIEAVLTRMVQNVSKKDEDRSREDEEKALLFQEQKALREEKEDQRRQIRQRKIEDELRMTLR